MFTTLQKYIAAAVVGALLLFGTWLYWHNLQSTITKLRNEVQTQTDRADLAVKVASSQTATTKIVTQTVERVVEVKVKGDTIVQKVPVYVTAKADSQCVVTNGTVSVFNAAASNMLLPGAASGVQDGPSGVALSTLTGTAAQWASLYYQLDERYKGLREWAQTQGAICSGGGGVQQK